MRMSTSYTEGRPTTHTFAVWLHLAGDVDRVTKQTISRHRLTHHAWTHHTSTFTTQVTWLPSPRSEAQALGWCCMRSIFLQIRVIFSSPEGYWLHFSILHAYFVYIVWHCTDKHFSSIYACTVYVGLSFVCRYVAPAGECYCNTVLYNAACEHAVSLHCAKNIYQNKSSLGRASSLYPRLPLRQISFLSQPPLLS